jgi:hypothetical protein
MLTRRKVGAKTGSGVAAGKIHDVNDSMRRLLVAARFVALAHNIALVEA